MVVAFSAAAIALFEIFDDGLVLFLLITFGLLLGTAALAVAFLCLELLRGILIVACCLSRCEGDGLLNESGRGG
jgi:hypothetical protein